MEGIDRWLPQARNEGLVVHELHDEVLIYDLERHRSHCLNRAAALVWRSCDGRSSVAEIAALLHREWGVPPEEEGVWLALERLGKAHLLRERLPLPAGGARTSRRALVRRLAMAGGLALVTSIIVPEAYAAASIANGAGCSHNSQCMSSHCCRQTSGATTGLCQADQCNPSKCPNGCLT